MRSSLCGGTLANAHLRRMPVRTGLEHSKFNYNAGQPATGSSPIGRLCSGFIQEQPRFMAAKKIGSSMVATYSDAPVGDFTCRVVTSAGRDTMSGQICASM